MPRKVSRSRINCLLLVCTIPGWTRRHDVTQTHGINYYYKLRFLQSPYHTQYQVCDTPELWCGAAGLCARVRACAGAAESLHTYIHTYT